MSPNAPFSAPASSSTAHRQRMEACIDELADLARTGIPPAQFLGEILARLRQFSGATVTRLWRPLKTGSWEVSGQLPADSDSNRDRGMDVDTISWLNDAAQKQQLMNRTEKIGLNGKSVQLVRTICPIVHTGQTVGLLDVTHEHETNRELSPEVAPFLHALSDITADFMTHAELLQLRQARTRWQQWDQFSAALMQSTSVSDVAATIVNDGRLLAECDRVSLLRRSGSKYVTMAITGVERVDPRSNSVRSIDALADAAAGENQSIWFNAASPATEADNLPGKGISEHIRVTGARAVGVIPLQQPALSSEATPSPARAVLVVEQFQDVPDDPAWRSRAEVLALRSQPLLLSALDRESIPFIRTLERWRHTAGWLLLSRLRLAMLFAILTAGMLYFVPAEFTVTGPAELVPDHRREVFASSSGIVDQLLVKHGDDVELDQPLIVLTDPPLALELPKINGEIEVIRERLKGILATRLGGGSTPDATNRARQLASDEEELKERQQSLIRQRQLIEQQQSALTLKSPIRGKVMTWDVSTLLSARPVERGQALLTIGDTDGPWVLEMRIADKDFGHVRRAQKKLKPNLDVDFLLASDPSRTLRGTIRDVAETTHLDDQIGNSVLITVAIDRNQVSNRHAGATAIPRIRCGRHSIGYVWLHDLVDVIRTQLLF